MTAPVRARYGPRIGPRAAAGEVRVSTRLLEGREFLIWDSPNYLAVYAAGYELIHLWIKDPT
ncbi:hypothetical protein [Streptacidiphilus sp. EB103A]|uniref:hypothetical protein n=1 Tax=Streptacidiphilus sp. EB103A TaxID=3156275 RepID=UPI00351992E5